MSTQAAVQATLRAATLRIIRAHDFSKTSTVAVNVLVDLLGRFFELLAGAASEHAQFAGRRSANLYDALAALEETGIDLGDVMQWYKLDGAVLGEYAAEKSLANPELAAALRVGLVESESAPMLLEYRPVSEDENDAPDSPSSSSIPSPTLVHSIVDEDYDGPEEFPSPGSIGLSPSPPLPPDLPNNDMKGWTRLVGHHTHDNLPPWPMDGEQHHVPKVEDLEAESFEMDIDAPVLDPSTSSAPLPPSKRHPPRPLPTTTSSVPPLYAPPVPYSSSTTTSTDLFPPPLPSPPHRSSPLSLPPAHPYLLIALQTALELPTSSSASNPARLAVSAALSSAAANRYTSSDSLFSLSSSTPPPPRHLAPAPTHAIPSNPLAPTVLLPPAQSRSIKSALHDSLDPQPPHISTHIRVLEDRLIKPGVLERSTTLTPPTVFTLPPSASSSSSINIPGPTGGGGGGGKRPMVYGRPVRAPWNKPASSAVNPAAGGGKGGGPVLTDALMYATWEIREKRGDEALRDG